jgi:transposase
LRSRALTPWRIDVLGFFFGTEKGPCLFWEKEWGNITTESYGEHTLLLIDDGIARLTRSHGDPELIIMQDSAPSHRNILTIEELRNRGLYIIEWPPYSPDLNPIEQVWDWMKEWIGQSYLLLQDRKLSYDQLRQAVKAAWDALPTSFLEKQIDLMQARCQAVIDAQGGITPY